MELKQIEYSCFRPHADLSSSFLSKVDLLRSCWESDKNWMQSMNSRPSLAATQWNSSKAKRYIPQGGNCMGVFTSLPAWDEQHQFYMSDLRRLGLQPISPRCSTCTKQTRYRPFLFTTRQFLMSPYIQLDDTTDKCVKRVSTLMLSVPISPTEGQNSTSTSTKIYYIDPYQRISCPFPR